MAKSQLRAAAYCRVSTNKAEQLDSYSAQQDFFKEYCQRHEFQLLRIYGDEGKSGTKMKNRKQLLDAFEKLSEQIAQAYQKKQEIQKKTTFPSRQQNLN